MFQTYMTTDKYKDMFDEFDVTQEEDSKKQLNFGVDRKTILNDIKTQKHHENIGEIHFVGNMSVNRFADIFINAS